jgi:cell division protein FtsL
MTPQSTETLLINLQTTIKHLEETIESKNKEIENLKGLIFKLQDIKESK